jgi:hypothetical protein
MVFILSIALSCLFLTTNAHAYIDPGTGSIIIQLIIAAIASITVFFKKIKNKVTSFFKKFKKYI